MTQPNPTIAEQLREIQRLAAFPAHSETLMRARLNAIADKAAQALREIK
jgi:hypothetical protein